MPLYCIHTYANSTVYGTVFKHEFLHVYWAAEVSIDCYCRQALLWFPKEDGEKYKPKHLNTIVFQIFINFYICNYWSEKIILILFIMKFVARYIWKVQILYAGFEFERSFEFCACARVGNTKRTIKQSCISRRETAEIH